MSLGTRTIKSWWGSRKNKAQQGGSMATLRVGTSPQQAATNHSITLKDSYDEWEELRIKFAKSDTKTVILKDQQSKQLQIWQPKQ